MGYTRLKKKPTWMKYYVKPPESDYLRPKTVFWRYAPDFSKALQARISEYDLVHIHGLWFHHNYSAANIAHKAGVPYVISPHGMVEPAAINRKWLKKRLYWKAIQRGLLGRAAAIHCITEDEAGHVVQMVPTSTSFTVPNGVQVNSSSHKSFPQRTCIGFLGRFHPIKGLDNLLYAVAKLPENNVSMLIAGDGEPHYEQHFRKLTHSLGLDKKAHFMGFINQDEIPAFFDKISFLAVPSYSEVLSLAAIEAIAHATPVLITRQSGFHLIETHHAGLVISDNKPETICDGIQHMIKEDLAAVSQNAYRLAQEQFDIARVAAHMKENYEQIIRSLA